MNTIIRIWMCAVTASCGWFSLTGCSEDASGCQRDLDCGCDQICDNSAGQCVAEECDTATDCPGADPQCYEDGQFTVWPVDAPAVTRALQEGSMASSEQLSATSITRITHPCVELQNSWQGEQHGAVNGGTAAWNNDYKKIMWYEVTPYGNTQPPGCNHTARGFVWGNLADLKNLGGTVSYSDTLQNTYNYTNDYIASYSSFLANSTPMPAVFKNSENGNKLYHPPVWSKAPEESDIIYGLQRVSSSKLIVWKYNTATGSNTNILTLYDPLNNITSNPFIWGWKRNSNNFYIVITDEKSSYSNWRGWEINPLALTSIYWTNAYPDSMCSGEGLLRPYGTIHTGRSPDGAYIVQYGADEGVSNCTSWTYGNMEYQDNYWQNMSHFPVHSAWFDNSNNYYLSGDPGYKGEAPLLPWMANYRIYQTFYNRADSTFTHHEVLQFKGAGRWDPNPKYSVSPNYHAHIIPTLRKDGKQLLFYSTNNAYSLEDKYFIPSTTAYSSRGMFIADLE